MISSVIQVLVQENSEQHCFDCHHGLIVIVASIRVSSFRKLYQDLVLGKEKDN